MKTRLFSFKRIFSGICIAVFVVGQAFSVYSALYPDAFPAFLSTTASSSQESYTSTPSEAQSSSLPESSLISSAITSIVPLTSLPNVLTDSKYKETPEDKKQDPTASSKPVDDDRKSNPPLTDTVPKQDVINAVLPYVIRVTANNVRLRTVMSTASGSSIYKSVNTGQRLLCNAECTAKDGSSWRRVFYDGRNLFISVQFTEATKESLDSLNSKPQSSSSPSAGSSSSPVSSLPSSLPSSSPIPSSSSPGSSAPSDVSSENSSAIPPPANLKGWQTIEGKTYYYLDNKPITGWQVIGGLRHLFDSSGVKISKAGIDVSRYQADIDWKSVKEAGIDFAIIRVGYRGYGTGKLVLDTYFEKNMKGAAAAGIPCGVYIYSTAINTTEAREEAAFVLGAVQKYKLEYPIMYDVERHTDRCAGLTKKQFTDNTIEFMETVKAAGYKTMYYTYRSFLQNYLEYDRLKSYDLWLAMYSNKLDDSPVSIYNYKIWQYSSSGRISGIIGDTDLNIQVKPI